MNNIVNSNIQILYSGEENRSEKYRHYRDLWNSRPIEKTPGDFPLFLDLDVSTACNFSCPSCSCTINKANRNFMSLGLYRQIIDEAAENGCCGVKFHTICRGEPLLNPNIIEMVRYAKKKGMVDVRMNTNGSLLSPAVLKDLIVVGLDMIIFSIDGSSKVEYRKSGRSGDFDQLESHVWMAKEYGGKYNKYGKTQVRVQAIDFDYLDKERFKKVWSKWADEVSVIDYQDMRARRFGLKTDSWHCPMVFQRLSILHDGTILPCNLDDRLISGLGSFCTMSIKEAWNSEMMGIIRNLNTNHLGEFLGLCDGCYLRTNEIMKENDSKLGSQSC